jgi:eukaryotic-like serine/threonine-protein kinase
MSGQSPSTNRWCKTIPRSRITVAGSLRGRAQALPGLGDPAGAAADTHRALELWDGLPPRSGEDWFEVSCSHATLAALAEREGSGVSSGEAPSEADKAMALLTRAVGMGYRDANQFRIETALDSLRNRPDFQLLMMDLAFPADPFNR